MFVFVFALVSFQVCPVLTLMHPSSRSLRPSLFPWRRLQPSCLTRFLSMKATFTTQRQVKGSPLDFRRNKCWNVTSNLCPLVQCATDTLEWVEAPFVVKVISPAEVFWEPSWSDSDRQPFSIAGSGLSRLPLHSSS